MPPIEIISIDGNQFPSKIQQIKLDKNTTMEVTQNPTGGIIHVHDKKDGQLGHTDYKYFCEKEFKTTIHILDHDIKIRSYKDNKSISQNTLPSHQTPEK